ncbi:hypothetical protein OC195_15640 [Priestia flexa]|nr:hypothetical protein OC195_15640 [Priestia flexa]
MYDMVIKNARLLHAVEVVNIGVSNGRFMHITKDLVDGKKVIDAKGGIVIPPFVELHTHFDTALTAGWYQALIEPVRYKKEFQYGTNEKKVLPSRT